MNSPRRKVALPLVFRCPPQYRPGRPHTSHLPDQPNGATMPGGLEEACGPAAQREETMGSRFLRNQWYVAATSAEVGTKPFGRMICNEPVVLFRRADGRVAVLEDRCPHRM